MKLTTFQPFGGPARLGAVTGDGLVDLSRRLSNCPSDMMALIARWPEFKTAVQGCVDAREADWRIEDVELLAPVLRPGKIFGIGLNYADHIVESGLPRPDQQVWFSKAVTAINGPFGSIEQPIASSALDYEAELAFVIGKRCRHVARERAHEVIFGYCIANDVSVRDWQLRTSQFLIGKSFDTHCPVGPWIVTPDELSNPHALDIRSFVNDEKRQESNTRELIFDCFDQVAHLSQAMTLEPGDLILTGTPGGVGIGFKPPRYLVPGDVVRVEIDGIGAIEHRVIAEEPAKLQDL